MSNNYDKIIDYLYLGNYKSLEDHEKFTFIVNCTKNIDSKSINYLRIPINDDPYESNLLLSFIYKTDVLNIIHDYIIMKENVLVHCSAGMQRSCALVVCYLIKFHNYSPRAAIEFIKDKRPIAFFGNVNFLSTIELFYLNHIS